MFKKIILGLLIIVILGGCNDNKANIYDSYVDKISKIHVSSSNLPFDINVKMEKLTTNEGLYQVIIDNVEEPLLAVKAMIIHDKDNDNIFPSIGILDDSVNLSKTGNDNFEKGIILSGYLPLNLMTDVTFKIMVEYTKNNVIETKYYVITSSYVSDI